MATLTELNIITLTGRIGREPQLKQTAKGSSFLSFSLANNRETEFGVQLSWFNVKVWGDELARALHGRLGKGDHVTVVGRIDTNYDREAGVSYLNIVAEDVQKNLTASTIKSLNSVMIAGRLGRDPQYRQVGKAKDRPMLSFSIASSHTDDFTFAERTTWVNIVAWAEEARKLSSLKLTKGQHVTVRGYLETRVVGEGEERKTFSQVVVERVEVNDRRGDKRHSGAGNGALPFEHYSQRTTFDRHTDSWDTTPDHGDDFHAEEEQRDRKVAKRKARGK